MQGYCTIKSAIRNAGPLYIIITRANKICSWASQVLCCTLAISGDISEANLTETVLCSSFGLAPCLRFANLAETVTVPQLWPCPMFQMLTCNCAPVLALAHISQMLTCNHSCSPPHALCLIGIAEAVPPLRVISLQFCHYSIANAPMQPRL